MEEEKIAPIKEELKPVISKIKPVKKKKELSPPKVSKFSAISIVLTLVTVAAIGVGAYFGWQNYNLKKNPNMIAQQETQQLIDKVGKLMELPKDETPTVATVTDKEKVKEKAFFKNTENEDKVLIYVKAEKAILYRPSTNKIIGVTSVLLDKSQSQNSSAPANATPADNSQPDNQSNDQSGNQQSSDNQDTSQQKIKVAIYNGTKTAGLTLKAEEKVTSEMSNLEIIKKDNAKKNDYEKTIVADVSGNHSTEAEQMAKALGGEVTSLPDGEDAGGADIVVVVAQ